MNEEREWPKHHEKLRQRFQLPAGQPWTDQGGKCNGVHAARGRDVVNLSYAMLLKNGVAPHMVGSYLVDISQSLNRKAFGQKVRNLTTSSSLFCFAKDRLLSAQEHFSVLGMPTVNLSEVSDHQARELAGQAMAAPCIALPLLIVALSLPGVWTPSRGMKTAGQ